MMNSFLSSQEENSEMLTRLNVFDNCSPLQSRWSRKWNVKQNMSENFDAINASSDQLKRSKSMNDSSDDSMSVTDRNRLTKEHAPNQTTHFASRQQLIDVRDSLKSLKSKLENHLSKRNMSGYRESESVKHLQFARDQLKEIVTALNSESTSHTDTSLETECVKSPKPNEMEDVSYFKENLLRIHETNIHQLSSRSLLLNSEQNNDGASGQGLHAYLNQIQKNLDNTIDSLLKFQTCLQVFFEKELLDQYKELADLVQKETVKACMEYLQQKPSCIQRES